MAFNAACKTNLALANEARLKRAAVKRRLKTGEMPFDEFLDETPACVAHEDVGVALTWLAGIREVKADKILRRARIDPSVAVSALTAVERYRLHGLVVKT